MLKFKLRLFYLLLIILFHTKTYANPIIFASEATYPPIVYLAPDQTFKGLEVDIINAICKQEHLSCEFKHEAFDNLILSLNMGTYSVIFGGIETTPERQKEVIFTEPMYQSSAAFIKRKDTDVKKIGVQQGSTMLAFANKFYKKKYKIKSYASLEQAFLDLKSTRIDAILGDALVLNYWLKASDIIGLIIEPQHDFPKSSGYAIAVAKNNTLLLQKLNHGIAILKQNGTLAKIITDNQK